MSCFDEILMTNFQSGTTPVAFLSFTKGNCSFVIPSRCLVGIVVVSHKDIDIKNPSVIPILLELDMISRVFTSHKS